MSFNRLFGAAAIATVIAGLALAFTFLGTPSHQRLVALDDVRVSDLQRTASLLRDRYPSSALPIHLPRDLALQDPVTKQSYEYRRVDATRYVVCVRFNHKKRGGGYAGVKDIAAVFMVGRFDHFVDKAQEPCAGATYAPFPELQKLSR